MTKTCIALMVAAAALLPAQSKDPFIGRWDLTITAPHAQYPSWLEVNETDGKLEARAQQREGAVHPVADVRKNGAQLLVTIWTAAPAINGNPPRAELVWDLSARGGRLTGVQKRGGAEEGRITGERSPSLERPAPAAWTTPEPLFNGKDLTGWVTADNTQNPKARVSHWVVEKGELVNQAQGHNIMTTRKFQDFKLHVEFNLAPGANSGIYLRGRYECQMPPPASVRDYAIYGMVPAIAAAPGKAGEWRTYDITLVGRTVTLEVNGTTIVDHQKIAGITGGALDSHEAEPGPILLQGDHTGGIRYRNITISLPKRQH